MQDMQMQSRAALQRYHLVSEVQGAGWVFRCDDAETSSDPSRT